MRTSDEESLSVDNGGRHGLQKDDDENNDDVKLTILYSHPWMPPPPPHTLTGDGQQQRRHTWWHELSVIAVLIHAVAGGLTRATGLNDDLFALSRWPAPHPRITLDNKHRLILGFSTHLKTEQHSTLDLIKPSSFCPLPLALPVPRDRSSSSDAWR